MDGKRISLFNIVKQKGESCYSFLLLHKWTLINILVTFSIGCSSGYLAKQTNIEINSSFAGFLIAIIIAAASVSIAIVAFVIPITVELTRKVVDYPNYNKLQEILRSQLPYNFHFTKHIQYCFIVGLFISTFAIFESSLVNFWKSIVIGIEVCLCYNIIRQAINLLSFTLFCLENVRTLSTYKLIYQFSINEIGESVKDIQNNITRYRSTNCAETVIHEIQKGSTAPTNILHVINSLLKKVHNILPYGQIRADWIEKLLNCLAYVDNKRPELSREDFQYDDILKKGILISVHNWFANILIQYQNKEFNEFQTDILEETWGRHLKPYNDLSQALLYNMDILCKVFDKDILLAEKFNKKKEVIRAYHYVTCLFTIVTTQYQLAPIIRQANLPPLWHHCLFYMSFIEFWNYLEKNYDWLNEDIFDTFLNKQTSKLYIEEYKLEFPLQKFIIEDKKDKDINKYFFNSIDVEPFNLNSFTHITDLEKWLPTGHLLFRMFLKEKKLPLSNSCNEEQVVDTEQINLTYKQRNETRFKTVCYIMVNNMLPIEVIFLILFSSCVTINFVPESYNSPFSYDKNYIDNLKKYKNEISNSKFIIEIRSSNSPLSNPEIMQKLAQIISGVIDPEEWQEEQNKNKEFWIQTVENMNTLIDKLATISN